MSTVYFPSLVMNLRLRFDEAIQVAIPSAAPPAISTETLTTFPPPTLPASILPLLLSGTVDRLSWILGRVPKSASVELPAYRQAGTFHMTFEYRDLPFDPRILRAVGVEIHLGCVSADDFAQGMRRPNADGSRSSVLKTRDLVGNPREDTLVMIGVVDNATIEHSASGSDITLEGRDLRGMLFDAPIDPALLAKVNYAQDIVHVVAEIVHLHPLLAQVEVKTRLSDWDGGIVPSPAGHLQPRARKGAKGAKVGGTSSPRGSKNDLKFWDYITDLCYRVGAIPFFQGATLFVRQARALYDLQRAGLDPTIPTPFAGGKQRVVLGVPPFGIRKMVYGRNIERLKFERKMGGERPKVVEVSAYNSSSPGKKLMTARWPEAPTAGGAGSVAKAKKTNIAPSGAATQEDIIRLPPIHGVADQTQLNAIARNAYEEMGRQEIGGSVETKDCASFGGDNADPDLLRLKPGDAVELLIDARSLSSRNPLVTALTEDTRRSLDDLIAEWTQRLGDADLARVLVLTSRGVLVGLSNLFRVANVKYSWNAQNGVSVAFDFQNYLEVRAEVGGPPVGPPGTEKAGT